MFWTRSPASPAHPADASAPAGVLQAATSRSMGFFASLDVLGASSDARATPPSDSNQSAGETAREDTAPADSEPAHDALPPSYILSEQRRHELLRAARATRTLWVDGRPVGESDAAQWTRHGGATAEGAVPPHCQAAADQIVREMQALVVQVARLKHQILPNELLAQDAPGSDNNANERLASVPIVEELRARQDELESWRRVHLTDGRLSPMQRKRLTASDKEALFLLAFADLVALLKHPLAAEVVYQIQMFVKKVEHWDLEAMLRHRALSDRPGGHVQSFIDKLVRQLQRTGAPLFQAAGVEILSLDDDEEQLLCEVLEAFLLEKLYLKALTPSAKAEREDDDLRDRLQSLSFVEFRHLDLPVPKTDETEQQWVNLTEQLAMISRFPSARRKMDCVMRVCQGLTALLSSLHANGKFPSADEFLPGLIYLLLKSNPRQLKRNVHFILEYRRPSRLVSEPGYFFTHLVSSVAFLEQVNGELLTITPEEFEAGLRKSKAQIAAEVARSSIVTKRVAENPEEDDCGPRATDGRSGPVVQPRLPTVMEIRAKRLAATAMCS